MSDNVPLLLISGPPGVGKTTVAWEIFDQIVQEGGKPTLVDLDLLGACWPAPDDDPHNEKLKARNLAAMWSNFYDAGARCLIAAGVIENRDLLELYRGAIPGARATLCRLTAEHQTLRSRIVQRGRERGDGIEKLYRRAVELSAQLDANDGADITLNTSDLQIREVARLVKRRWL